MGKRSRRRSATARKGWDTRTRHQGMRQIGKAVIGRSSPVISTARFVKNVSLGAHKMINPRSYRRNTLLKKIDKHL